jgi:steroid delta-isomerase-like uncharacterized protein
MNALEVSQRSTDAWNRHDADGLVAVYAEGGTYHNPRLDHALTGQAIGDFNKSVLTAYPDLRFEVISSGDTGGGLVALQWVLHGTHTGKLMDGTPPTGRTVAHPGASFTQVEGDKIRSEHIYFDRRTVGATGAQRQISLTFKAQAYLGLRTVIGLKCYWRNVSSASRHVRARNGVILNSEDLTGTGFMRYTPKHQLYR